jgi:hypothetical protein
MARKIPRRPRKKDVDFARRTKERHAHANDKVVATVTVSLGQGRFSGHLTIPEGLRHGTYWLRFQGMDSKALGGRGTLILGAKKVAVSARE